MGKRVSRDIDRKKASEEGALTLWRGQNGGTTQDKRNRRTRGHSLSEKKRRREKLGTKRGGRGKGQLTNWRGQKKGQVGT
jgi:hypothetical protein